MSLHCERDSSPSAALRRLVNGYQVSQAIHVAATLTVADLLRDGPRVSDDLAAATASHPDALYRLLRALASIGVFHEDAGRRFSLTALGECLCRDAPEPVAGWAVNVGRPYHRDAWGALLYSVRRGENAMRHVTGMDAWEYRVRHPEEGAIFDRAMTDLSRRAHRPVLEAYDFSRFSVVVDVGGGQGALLAAVLAASPALRGVLFDQPSVVAGARVVLERAGVEDRCTVVDCWEDDEAVAVLRSCRRAIADDGALLVIERDLGEPNEQPAAKFSDLTMLVLPGGRERTLDEYGTLFQRAGFELVGVTPTASEMSIFEGRPAAGMS
jgi:hypothetical protein